MKHAKQSSIVQRMLTLTAALSLSACAGDATYTPSEATGVTVSTATATTACTPANFSYPGVTITSATLKAAGQTETAGNTGSTVTNPEYCLVKGTLNSRTSTVDGKTYGIGFEMRFPSTWNGRFFYQPNGGLDGNVAAAIGDILGGGQLSSGLTKGFVTLSSDAGHNGSSDTTVTSSMRGGTFGIDPQARLDYGYNAVASLTPMAKNFIKTYFGKKPDKSYIVGGSNGGRHVMVTASRLGDQYDGFIASAPGFNLPKAAVAQIWGAQQLATISATNTTSGSPYYGLPDVTTSLSATDMALVGKKIIEKCDALDGVADNMVFDVKTCQTTFNIVTDVPTCTSGSAVGTCLTNAQKLVLANMHAGAQNSSGSSLYNAFLWSEGISSSGWRTWKMNNSTNARDPLSVAFVFMTPPVATATFNGTDDNATLTNLYKFAINYNNAGFSVDKDAPKIFQTNSTYTESAMSFMTPPDLTMSKMVQNHGKMILVHGTGDPVFSAKDTMDWYDTSFKTKWGSATSSHARLFLVPGMGHVRGGPTTDQYDMVDAVVNWVEKGIAPDSIIAKARGVGSGSVVNTEVPATWSATRTRLLCPYPQIAKYNGTGNIELASSFSCVAP